MEMLPDPAKARHRCRPAAGPAGPDRVFAFEPEPENFALLTENVRLNGYRNVALEPSAVADRTSTMRLWVNHGSNRGDHRIYDPREPARSVVDVAGVALDAYFAPRTTAVDFVKIDIQGAEWLALHGMAATLERSPSVRLLTEFWPRGLALAGVAPADFLRWLEDRSFRFCDVDERRRVIEPVDADTLLARYTVDGDEFTNLLCMRSVVGSEPSAAGLVAPARPRTTGRLSADLRTRSLGRRRARHRQRLRHLPGVQPRAIVVREASDLPVGKAFVEDDRRRVPYRDLEPYVCHTEAPKPMLELQKELPAHALPPHHRGHVERDDVTFGTGGSRTEHEGDDAPSTLGDDRLGRLAREECPQRGSRIRDAGRKTLLIEPPQRLEVGTAVLAEEH